MVTKEEIEAELSSLLEEINDDRYACRWIRYLIYAVSINVTLGIALSVFNGSFYVSFLFGLIAILANIFISVGSILGIFLLLSLFVGGMSRTAFPIGHIKIWSMSARKKHKAKLLRYRLSKMLAAPVDPKNYSSYYLQIIPQDIREKRISANRYQLGFIVTQSIIILLSTTVASISGGWLDRYFTWPWLIPVLSGLISLITGYSLFFKLREKGTNLRQTADALDLEYKAYLLGHGDYSNEQTALKRFTEKVEIIRKEQLQRQQQLEQSSQQDHTPPTK